MTGVNFHNMMQLALTTAQNKIFDTKGMKYLILTESKLIGREREKVNFQFTYSEDKACNYTSTNMLQHNVGC